MANNARGIHVSPGIYSKETELSYAVKSLGITTLGLVGETLKGPAFEPVSIENWREFQDVFGGTSPEKFKESQYPKYELPYIAKSYLSESNQLEVCRVLGLSGYNAGPAWVIKTYSSTPSYNNIPIAVLRSRGHYEKYYKYTSDNGSADLCSCSDGVEYDALVYDVAEGEHTTCTDRTHYKMDTVTLEPYTEFDAQGNPCTTYQFVGSQSNGGYFPSTSRNYGKFRIVVNENGQEIASYAVSLNPADNDYIIKVLGTNPHDGDALLFVESLYDVAVKEGILKGGIEGVAKELEAYEPIHINEYVAHDAVASLLRIPEASLTRNHLNMRFLADASSTSMTAHKYSYENGAFDSDLTTVNCEIGHIYTVKQYTDESGKRHYYYASVTSSTEATNVVSAKTCDYLIKLTDITTDVSYPLPIAVKVNEDGRYYKFNADGSDVEPITVDMNNYKSAYRFASTPWFVSNVMGDLTKIDLVTLFRFHTISDGNTANNEVKVSIANVDYDNKLFDVYVRRIDDTDGSPVILEKYSKCNMIPTSKNYIAYKIGSYDGTYELKSKYITVEVNETLTNQNAVPCGFLGYPLTQFQGADMLKSHSAMTNVPIAYNTNYYDTKKVRKQYFGLSDIVGVDLDMFSYKGENAYFDDPSYLSQGFHLDSRVGTTYTLNDAETANTVTVNGIQGFKFDVVSPNNITSKLSIVPIIGREVDMEDSIYENINARKFTAYFYGGFDGWDEYRDARTTTDEFTVSNYKGEIGEQGLGYAFDLFDNPEPFNLTGAVITSDYYAYLGAARQFANPESIDINVFATPGIDLINNKLLSQDIIDMIEEERADSIYVATLPDKPYGAYDYQDEMYTPDEIVSELDDTEIDSNYTCTYYPWIKYKDNDNNQYVFLSPTKDVVRNMAMTDNTTQPWFAPAGISRGSVDCARAHYVTKLADEDVLYEGRINPIKTFAQDGVKIWGQKNLQIAEGQLNRIAVRRLLLRMRKLISIACLNLIFDPNDATTKNKFLSLVTPIMDNIKSNRGISDYRIEVNDTVESRERRELPAKIYFKPYSALEYIDLEFVVTPESVSFDEI